MTSPSLKQQREPPGTLCLGEPHPVCLLVDSSYYGSFLASAWLNRFSGDRNALGIAVQADTPTTAQMDACVTFHQSYAGATRLDDTAREMLSHVYPEATDVVAAAIRRFGVPDISALSCATWFVGRDLNAVAAKDWRDHLCASIPNTPFLFTFIDQVLDETWPHTMPFRILNGHPAVLPYAPGYRAIESIARRRDATAFRAAAGATLHYITSELDAGPIISARRLANAFAFDTLAEVRAYSFALVIDLITTLAAELLLGHNALPVGVVPERNVRGILSRKRDSTPEARAEAADAYSFMKAYATSNLEG